jgi:hypothetical protein
MMFRSPDSRASPRISKHQVPEGPIHDFTNIIERTSPEEWVSRTSALQTLVNAIPTGSDYYHGRNHHATAADDDDDDDDDNNNSIIRQWYNSPSILRHLAIPLSELIKDPRSTVVKRTCESCTQLFEKCQVDARYLLKDIMPAIIQVHASTVSVIRQYVQDMVVQAMTIVPCKMAMPLWLDRLKQDKSRTVREACCLYLSKGIEEWSTLMDEGYLTKDIFHQVGTVLIKALRDACPPVRQQARKGLEIFQGLQPDMFDHLISTHPELSQDLRTKKLLLRIQAGENVAADDVSVASRMSIASAPVRGGRAGTTRNTPSGQPPPSNGRLRSWISNNINSNIHGKPPAIPTSSTYDIPSTIGVSTIKLSKGLGPPQRVVTTSYSMDSVEENRSNDFIRNSSTTTSTSPFQSAVHGSSDVPIRSAALTPEDPDQSFDTIDTDTSELQPISSTMELRQVAKSRGMNSRRSSLLQDRLKRSSSNIIPESDNEYDLSTSNHHGGDDLIIMTTNTTTTSDSNGQSSLIGSTSTNIVDLAHLGADEIANHPSLPEHIKIAHQLLEAHKVHVDQVMEVLKVEMDALKDFELILLEKGPRRPTEEEVLEYFESLGLCLEQRTKAGQILQRKMDRISKGN